MRFLKDGSSAVSMDSLTSSRSPCLTSRCAKRCLPLSAENATVHGHDWKYGASSATFSPRTMREKTSRWIVTPPLISDTARSLDINIQPYLSVRQMR